MLDSFISTITQNAWWIMPLTCIPAIILLMLPWLLRKRGVKLERGRFGWILIFDSENEDGDGVRLLNVGGTFQSVSFIDEGLQAELACIYHRHMADIIHQVIADGEYASAYVLGGGGYSLPKYLTTYEPTLDLAVIEIDPKMTQIARESFFLDDVLARAKGSCTLIQDDAWRYLLEHKRRVNIIVNDAFAKNKPLGELGTQAGADLIVKRLCTNGVYLANVRCPLSGKGAHLLEDLRDSFASELAHLAYIPEWPDEPKKSGNNVFIATNRVLKLPKEAIIIR